MRHYAWAEDKGKTKKRQRKDEVSRHTRSAPHSSLLPPRPRHRCRPFPVSQHHHRPSLTCTRYSTQLPDERRPRGAHQLHRRTRRAHGARRPGLATSAAPRPKRAPASCLLAGASGAAAHQRGPGARSSSVHAIAAVAEAAQQQQQRQWRRGPRRARQRAATQQRGHGHDAAQTGAVAQPSRARGTASPRPRRACYAPGPEPEWSRYGRGCFLEATGPVGRGRRRPLRGPIGACRQLCARARWAATGRCACCLRACVHASVRAPRARALRGQGARVSVRAGRRPGRSAAGGAGRRGRSVVVGVFLARLRCCVALCSGIARSGRHCWRAAESMCEARLGQVACPTGSGQRTNVIGAWTGEREESEV